MRSPIHTAFFVAPALALGIVGLAGCDAKSLDNGILSCDEFSASASYGASLDVDARAKVFMSAAGHFQVLGDSMVSDVSAACVDIATAAGGDASKWQGKTGSDLAQAACDEAAAKVKATFGAAAKANVSLSVQVTGGHCEASLDAAAQCNAQCDVDGKCKPGELEATCEPGKLAGSCSATCQGTCELQPGSVDCSGSCGGTCTGDCAGDCSAKDANGKCAGTCSGTCTGTCSGSCEIENASGSCSGTCHGDCSVAMQAPTCEGKIEPPTCHVDADCEASCSASVSAQATCTPPTVSYVITGDASAVANLEATITALEADLPKLLLVAKTRGQEAVADVQTLVDAGGSLKSALTSSAKTAVCIGAAIEASAKASVNVSVSVSASASVAGAAGAG